MGAAAAGGMMGLPGMPGESLAVVLVVGCWGLVIEPVLG